MRKAITTAAPTWEARYYADRLHDVNPMGDVGLILLWSPYEHVRKKLAREAPAVLDPARSRVATVANLYGDGLHGMLSNLLYNPQVRHLIAFGRKLGQDSCAEIEALLAHGLEETTLLGAPMLRIPGTSRYFRRGNGLDVTPLQERLTFTYAGKPSDDGAMERVVGLLDTLPRADPDDLGERVLVDIPDPDPREQRPSEIAGHQVIRATPLAAWEELVVRTMRFGRVATLADESTRLELHNVKTVITDPREHSREALARYGFDLEQFQRYQEAILDPELPVDISYNYGNRLRAHFDQGAGADMLHTIIEKLRKQPRTRGAYLSLWDNTRDLAGVGAPPGAATPCLVSLQFRETGDRLALTATYRVHNLLTAWLQNVYGLMAILDHVAVNTDLAPGPMTVISQLLGIDPSSSRYGPAMELERSWQRDDDVDHDNRKSSIREDPNGHFVVTADTLRGVVIAEHYYAGNLIKRYEERSGLKIQQKISGDMAISQVSHALWIARELTLAEQELRTVTDGREEGR
ncbi:thymidylate synthase [Conexibacter woesei]|uniref:thymidylate synthase n=1 Tax=Conexibacter woesei TaxID=191495 RepID=UPI0012DBF169|nr:thymidylate synthase [Conexibacter woesei]